MSDRPIWVQADKFLDAAKQASDMRTTSIVIALLAYGSNAAFKWDAETIASWLTSEPPADDAPCCADLLSMQDDLLRFFVALPDGRWVPSPEIFAVNNANLEAS